MDQKLENKTDPSVAVVTAAPDDEKKKKQEHFLPTTNTISISEAPDSPKRTFSFKRRNIRDVKRDKYLLIGFDTEFQGPADPADKATIEGGRAKYEVLSYQFYAENDTGKTWSGIAIPDQGERISFAEFIVFAISKGIQDHKIATVPKNIILVGHYNRADLPAFRERKDVLFKLKNIRKSFVSLGIPLTVRVSFSDREDNFFDLKVYVRDTILLAPMGKKSLAKIGELVGVPKMHLANNPVAELELKKNMKTVRANDWDLFKRYALLDAEICVLYFKKLSKMYHSLTGKAFIPTTLSSIGINMLIDGWKARTPPVDTEEIVGKEKWSETIWNERQAQFFTKPSKVYIEELHWSIDFVTECYHGGRGEQFWFGPSFEDDWSDYDLTSAYPTAMATIGKPDWKSIYATVDIDQILAAPFGFACVDFKFPDDTRYPTLPVRTENGIVFPLSERSYCVTPELEVARQLGCELTVRHGVIVPQDQNNKVFFDFIKKTITNRTNAGTEIEKAFWKEITNSSYGKTAQGLRAKRVYNMKMDDTEKVPESQISNPFYAAYITSFVRAAVGEIINRIPSDKMIFSITTDGFITNANDAEMDIAKQGTIASKYSQTQRALTGDAKVLSEKHAVKQVLGWRTRGQATIKPGGGDELEKRFVLARAGIKPPYYAQEVDEQNDYIVKLFFERTPDTRFISDVFVSVQEMILYNADLVSKRTSKRANMEFDFKRQPYAMAMTEVGITDNSGQPYQHIAFSTRPWRNIAEFKKVRSLWDDYRRKKDSRLCIKTIDDFKDFAEFFDMMNSLTPKKSGWLRSMNGDLKRLRRDLCRAFKHGDAGLQNYSTLTANEFAGRLNDRGLASLGAVTKRADVQNGGKVSFEPNCTPATKNVLKIVDTLLSGIRPKTASRSN